MNSRMNLACFKILNRLGPRTIILLSMLIIVSLLAFLIPIPHDFRMTSLLKTLDMRGNYTICKTENTFNYKWKHQDDPELAAYIRTLLRPPSVHAYNLKEPQRKVFTFPEHHQLMSDVYGTGRRDGFFIEVGGYDGESGSGSLHLEKELGFTGLLIEANPDNYKVLLQKNRKAYALYAAVSQNNMSGKVLFSGSGQQGKLAQAESKGAITVQAFPIYAIMKAMNVTVIDFFNLDIEGFEFKVIKTIPFDKIKIGLFVVEHLNIPEPKQDLIKYMGGKGFVKIHENGYDYFFADPNYLEKFKKEQKNAATTAKG